MTTIRTLAVLLSLCLLPGLSRAGAFDMIGLGARAQGMGNAYTAVADDATALYWNPAGLQGVRRSSIAFSHVDIQTLGLVSLDQIIYAQPFVFNNTVALGWTRLGTTPNVTFMDYSENTFVLSYQQPLLPELSVGLNLKVYQVLYDQSGGGFGIDLGARYQVRPELAVALMAENLNQPGIYWVTDNVDYLPVNLRLGLAGYINPDLIVSCDVDRLLEPYVQSHLGAELWLFSHVLALRAGVTHSPYENRFMPAAGLGFRFSYFELSYAYAGHFDLDGNHLFSLIWGF